MFSAGTREVAGRLTSLPFLALDDEAAYRKHYENTLRSRTILTFDGLVVRFPKWQFDHAFFESANRCQGDKSLFSLKRAKRMDWIEPALKDPTAELYEGWEKRSKVYTRGTRVCVVCGEYVIVIRLRNDGKSASFITAFPAEALTLEKIRSGPRWVIARRKKRLTAG